MSGPIETEVKIRVENPAEMLERLRSTGFSQSVPRSFEANTLYDTEGDKLRQEQMLLRLREVGGKGIITWKGRGEPGPHKSRPELETAVGSTEILHQILTAIGFQPSFRYEKYRTEFRSENGSGVVTFDETPIGHFLELEGPADWIDKTAKELGLSQSDYVLDSYGRLYITDCERRNVEPGNMTFPPSV